MMQTTEIPPEVVSTLREFSRDAKSGTITLEVKEGRIQKISCTTFRRVAPIDKGHNSP